jgi:hypothetical protein
MGRVLKLVINELIISNLITNSFQNEIIESNTIKRLTTVISLFHFVNIAEKEE